MKQKKERKTQNQMFMFFLHPVPFIHLWLLCREIKIKNFFYQKRKKQSYTKKALKHKTVKKWTKKKTKV